MPYVKRNEAGQIIWAQDVNDKDQTLEYVPEEDFVPPALPVDEQQRLRQLAYQQQSDPLFFEWQAALAENLPGADAKKKAWLAKRADIRAGE